MVDTIYEALLSPPFLWTGLQRFQDEDGDISFHSHSSFQFTSVIEGVMHFKFRNNTISNVSAGETIFIAPGTEHRWVTPPKRHSLALVLFCGNFPPINFGELGDWLAPHFKNEHWLIATPEKVLRQHVGKTRELIRNGNKAKNIQLFARHLEFLGELASLFFETYSMPEITEISPQIMKALYLIEHKYMETLSLSALASCAGLSVSHFAARFANEVGQSPVSYINELRTNKAAEMLLYSKMSIGEIAAETGFISEHYFSRVFRKFKSVPPGAYRKSGGMPRYEILTAHLKD